MRATDDLTPDPMMLAELEAIDATLAGEPVDPMHAEIAELALLVRAERPQIAPSFVAELDARVERQFHRMPGAGDPARRTPGSGRPARGFRHLWWQAGSGLAFAAALIAVVVVIGGGGSSSSESGNLAQRVTPAGPIDGTGTYSPNTRLGALSPTAAASATSATSTGAVAATPPPAPKQSGKFTGNFFGGGSGSGGGAASTQSVARGSAVHGSSVKSAAPASKALVPAAASATSQPSTVQPQANGRKQITSAQLGLVAPPTKIDTVAQEAFSVIGNNQGIVRHSTVSAQGRAGGYAQIQISVPSQNLARTVTALSQLQFADVISRTDQSQDVNDRYLVEVRHLNDAQALRTSLLKQLAAATTQSEIDSLNSQISDAESTIKADETALDSLNKKVNYSDIELTIQPGNVPVKHHHHKTPPPAKGFTIHKALHDAGRVLVVSAGVALIALAVLLPLGLGALVIAWIVLWMRRRSREQALDATT